MPRGEGSGPKELPRGRRNTPEPGSARLGFGLTDEKLRKWGFVEGTTFNIRYGPWFEAQNPYKVLATNYRSSKGGEGSMVERGVIVESTKTGNRFVVVPSSESAIDFFQYNAGDLESALENDEPPAGELVSLPRDKKE